MIIKVKDLLEEKNQSIAVDDTAEAFEYNDFEITPLYVRGRAWIDGSEVKIKLDSEYHLSGSCDRCLEKIDRNTKIEVFEEEELKEIREGEIDIERLVTENILLQMPGKVLCRSNCLGLCPDCGMNLNKGKCSCAENRINPQFAALEKLLKGEG